MSPEAALRSPHNDQDTEALFLNAFCSSPIQLAIGARPPKQRSNRADRIMGSGNWLV
jgi:hypothetical protein